MISLLFISIVLNGLLPDYSMIDGPTLLQRSINYHDPEGKWPTAQLTLEFEETRPDAEPRFTTINIDNVNGNFCIIRQVDGKKVKRHIIQGDCTYGLDETVEISPEEMQTFKLNDERTFTMRDYYLYLWGLPMKLNDVGTIIHEEVESTLFEGKETLKLKVTYEAETGSDTWYFYINPDTYAMIGYQFFHDELKGDGEFIVLGESEEVFGMRLPNHRSWFTNKDSVLLGTDSFTSFDHLKLHH